jgi:hypothetical protein
MAMIAETLAMSVMLVAPFLARKMISLPHIRVAALGFCQRM